MAARLVDGFQAIAPASLTGTVPVVGFEVGDMHLMIPEKWLTSTPSSLAEGIINKDIPAVNRARQEIKAATSNIGAFNTVFHMLVHGRSSMQWATRMSNQSTSPVSNVPTVIDRTTETANLDFDIMFESIKLAVGIKAPTVCYPLCSDFTDGFRYVNLTVSQIQKLFESGLVYDHCMRVVEEALRLRGFATFVQAKLELLQESIDMNTVFQPDVRFMMDHVRGVLASAEEENQEMEVIDDSAQQKKRRAGHDKGRRANKQKKAAKKAPEDEAWL